jgi:hypothetical protein
MRAAMEDGDARFVMHRDYRYAALVLPLHLDRWNATEKKGGVQTRPPAIRSGAG